MIGSEIKREPRTGGFRVIVWREAGDPETPFWYMSPVSGGATWRAGGWTTSRSWRCRTWRGAQHKRRRMQAKAEREARRAITQQKLIEALDGEKP